jgi:hypothetical protein
VPGRAAVAFHDTGGADPDGAFVFRREDWHPDPFIMKIETPSGSVGIGTMSPGAKLHVNGNFQVSNGTKSAVVNPDHHGWRKLYAFEQASNRFADEGKARLVNGLARVNVDPIFLETIEGDFLIHVTPYGDASLYVAEIGEDYFVIRAGEGRDDVAFAWLLTAARKGYADVRLEAVVSGLPAGGAD